MRHGSTLRLGAWLGLAFGAALAGACFDAPRPAVQFSCDPNDAPQCPEGYTCEADGCCHLNGSDYEENAGACQIGGGGLTGGLGSGSETGTGTSTSTTGDATTGTSDGGSTTAAGESGSTTAATDGGTTTTGS